MATFGAARAELSLLKFCRVATNVALNLFSAKVVNKNDLVGHSQWIV